MKTIIGCATYPRKPKGALLGGTAAMSRLLWRSSALVCLMALQFCASVCLARAGGNGAC
jgi:hypothetical protein